MGRFSIETFYGPAHDKTYKTCAISEDLDQTAHLRSLICVFTDRMCFLQPGYPNNDAPMPYWVDVQADLSRC